MTEKAPISVIIPCYRCARTLGRAVASVAAQSLCPAEVILIDDASDDDTREAMQRLHAQYDPEWIRLIYLDQNLGAGSARNAGWAKATQPYVAFLDADDAWHLRKIEIQYNFMVSAPEVVLSGHGFRMLKHGVLPFWPIDHSDPQPISKWKMLLSNQFVTPSVMVKRDIRQRFIERQRHMEDHMLWSRVVCSGEPVVKISADLAAIYKDPFGVTGLSANVWLMERSDLGNCLRLYREGYINAVQLIILSSYSMLKYVRRLLIYVFFLKWKK